MAENRGSLMDLQTIIDSVVKLPPTPQILPKLQLLLGDPNSGIYEIISLIKVDAPMTAQIVRMSNSAYFGGTEPAQSLEDAVGRLGFKEVYKIVSVAVTNMVMGEESPLYKLGKGELLHQSIACAVLMVELGTLKPSLNIDSSYTIGLLHSIGKVIINQYYLKHGLEIYDAESEMDAAMETKLLGFNHAEAGAAILRKWNFTSDIYEPIEYQLIPEAAPDFSSMATMLALAKHAIPALADENIGDNEVLESVDEALLKTLSIDLEYYAEAIANAREGMEEVKGMLEK